MVSRCVWHSLRSACRTLHSIDHNVFAALLQVSVRSESSVGLNPSDLSVDAMTTAAMWRTVAALHLDSPFVLAVPSNVALLQKMDKPQLFREVNTDPIEIQPIVNAQLPQKASVFVIDTSLDLPDGLADYRKECAVRACCHIAECIDCKEFGPCVSMCRQRRHVSLWAMRASHSTRCLWRQFTCKLTCTQRCCIGFCMMLL